MGLAAERDGAALHHGLEGCERLGGREADALVTVDATLHLVEARPRHRKRQTHVAPLECALGLERAAVLRVATRHGLVLCGGTDVVAARDILGGLRHRVTSE